MFGAADVQCRGTQDEVQLTFHEVAWEAATTQARITYTRLQATGYLSVAHSGWPTLPAEIQRSERQRYAGLWQRVLASLESRGWPAA
jgi:hypothetical protein